MMNADSHDGGSPEVAAATTPPKAASGHPWVSWLVVLALAGGGWWAWQKWGSELGRAPAAPPPAARPVSVAVATARVGDLPEYVTGLGNVIPLESVVVRTRVDGELIKVAFTEGQLVREGDLLAEIDPRPFQIQLALAEAQQAKDQSLVANARLDLKRYTDAREAIAQQLIDTAAALVTQYEAALKMDDAQIAAARLQLTYCRITSPISGRIGLRVVDRGNVVHANDAQGLATVSRQNPIAIQFSLPQDNLPRVIAAQKRGPIVADAFDRDLRTRLVSGVLSALDVQIDATSGTVRLKATFNNDDGALFPNQFVNVRLLVDTRRAAVLIPAAAAQRNAREATFVYLVTAAGTAEIRQVTLGPTTAGTVVVTEGLAPGDVVVTDGVDKLQAGSKVITRGSETRHGAKDGSTKDGATRPSSREDSPR